MGFCMSWREGLRTGREEGLQESPGFSVPCQSLAESSWFLRSFFFKEGVLFDLLTGGIGMAWPTRFLDADFCKCNSRKWMIYVSSTLKVANTIPLSSAKYCEDPYQSIILQIIETGSSSSTCHMYIYYTSAEKIVIWHNERLSNTYANWLGCAVLHSDTMQWAHQWYTRLSLSRPLACEKICTKDNAFNSRNATSTLSIRVRIKQRFLPRWQSQRILNSACFSLDAREHTHVSKWL